jgi:hypothetical protein
MRARRTAPQLQTQEKEFVMRIVKLSILLAVLLGAIAPATALTQQEFLLLFGNRAAMTPQPGGGCSQATAFLARNGGVNASATTTLICGLVTDGVWTKLDALYVFATDTSPHALLNWVSSTVATPATISGTIAFSPAGAGVCGFATAASNGSINTGFNPTTATSPNFVLNSNSVGVWDNATGAGDTTAFNAIYGTVTNNGGTNTIAVTSGSVISIALSNLTNSGPNPANTVAAGFYSASVTGASVRPIYKNGSVQSTGAISGTQAIFNGVITFPYNAFPSADPVCAAHIGGGLSSTDESNLYGRLHVYLQNVAGIP